MAEENEKIYEHFNQMNQLLEERENAIEKKLSTLRKYESELKAFEKEVTLAVADIEKSKQRLKKEEEKIASKWDEVLAYEKNLKRTMESVLEEKLAVEEKSRQLLYKELEETTAEEYEPLNIEELRKRIHAPVEEENSVSLQEDIKDAEEDNKVIENDPIPEIFRVLEKAIEKNYGKWTKIELLPERYCLEIGSRPSKEIRFFIKDNLVQVEIMISRKNARADRKTQSEIVNISRVETDWNIIAEENSIVCSFVFTEKTKVSLVLKKCSDFIKTYFK